ncbi:hypothetical protein GQ54DRAFT_217157 [Martensiomyces pterosporus]|nr:hypothetical protein GQ54DRAFT_217157 [Martensiomyces pterosporus]
MSNQTPFRAAWDASQGATQQVHAYAKQTLKSGTIRHAVLGRFRAGTQKKDLLIAHDSSLDLYSIHDGASALANICSAPVFGSMLDIACLRAPPEYRQELRDSSEERDGCAIAVLSEGGLLSLVHTEQHAKGRFRFRLLDQIQASAAMDDGSVDDVDRRMLRKIACDPYSRAIGLVSWLNSIELVLLDWSSTQSQYPRMCSVRPQALTGGAICDAAVLTPSRSESQRILLVAAVADDLNGSFSLHLYESWTCNTAPPSISLAAKLPLPHNIATPLYVVPLPRHPEHFLLITESEVAVVSAVQILSGDVHLYRQPLPRLESGGPDLVSAFSVAADAGPAFDSMGTVQAANTPGLQPASPGAGTFVGAMGRSPSMEHRSAQPAALRGDGRWLSEAAAVKPAQRVYIGTQSGSLFQISVTDKPSAVIAEVTTDDTDSADVGERMAIGQTMVYLGTDASFADGKAPMTDYVFVSGDCADHSIVHIAMGSDSLETKSRRLGLRDNGAHALSSLTRRVFPVIANQSPLLDLVLCPDASLPKSDPGDPHTAELTTAYWTSGRPSMGAIHRAQFGRAIEIEHILDTSHARSPSADMASAISKLWCFSIPFDGSSGVTHLADTDATRAQCFVLRQAESYVPITLDPSGEWRAFDPLQEYLLEKHLVFIGDSSVGNAVLCVSTGEASMLDVRLDSVSLSCELSRANEGEVFTHGAYAESAAGTRWAVVAARLPSSQGQGGSAVRIVNAAATTSYSQTRASLELKFEYEISALRVFALGPAIYIAVGTYEPRLQVYRLNEPSDLTLVIDVYIGGSSRAPKNHENEGDVMGVDDYPRMSSSRIANDIYILCSLTRCYVLLGLRDGTLIQVVVNGSLGCSCSSQMLRVVDTVEDSVGCVPVKFASTLSEADGDFMVPAAPAYSSGSSAQRVMMVTDMLYTVEVEPMGGINIVPCFAGEQPLPSICHLAPLARAYKDSAELLRQSCSRGAPNAGKYLAVSGDSAMAVLKVDFVSRCHIQALPIGDEPRRVIVDSETGMLVVAGVLPPISTATSPFPTSSLKVLGPRDGRIHAEVRFRPFELVHSLEAWHIKGRKSYRYICVGTGMYPSSSSSSQQGSGGLGQAKGGRLLIYNLKTLKRKTRVSAAASPTSNATASALAVLSTQSAATQYELKYVWESERAGPVVALAHLGESYLVVAAGPSCIVLKLDVVQKRLIECCEMELRFSATSLHVRGHDIAVGSQREAVHVLRFVPDGADGRDTLEMVHCARVGLCTADARYVSRDLVVGVDRTGYLFALGIPEKTGEFALDYIFGIHLGAACTRLKQGRLVQCLHKAEHLRSWRDGSEGGASEQPEKNDGIVVATVAGALWTLLRITRMSFELLRQLELAMLAKEPTHPAHPLLCVGGSTSRHRQRSDLAQANVVDGALSSIYLSQLTEDEQRELVNSSPELRRLAASILRSSKHRERAGADATEAAADAIRCLIHGFNRACVY